ncbi:hypothetical protein A3Q56_07272 [Intoshia linei]|uniref:Amino acid permease/ SLC12A domain-containing protein n=1 Tax=Intoshia linei TaxID=1819745 RepID=A0A177AS42_9BILA|nr:hypothetical protein A3Q56_07272 [Intoshia linei]
MASLYGSPRIIQSIAEVNAIPFSSFLKYTKGPNNIPVLATLLVTIISVVFICIGNINYVGPIVTIGFLLTYAFVNYAYFALMTTKQYEKIKNSNSAINRLDDEFNIPNMPKYLALFGSIVSVAIIFFINWIYALLNVMSLIIVYYYIHKYATGLLIAPIHVCVSNNTVKSITDAQGLIYRLYMYNYNIGMAKYNLLDWFKYTILRKKFKTKIILDYKFETASTVPQQQNHVNSDFQKRNNYHQSVKISNILDFSDI